MSGLLYLYTFEDANGDSFGSWSTMDAQTAKEYALEHRVMVIEHTYEWVESEKVEGWNFTPDEDEEE